MTKEQQLEDLRVLIYQLLKHLYILCVEIDGYENCQENKISCKECQLKWLNAEHKEETK